MAAPHVAGCAALLLQVTRGRLTNDELRDLILSNVDEGSSSTEPVERLGHGYLDIKRAVEAATRFTALALPLRKSPQLIDITVPKKTGTIQWRRK